MINEAWPYRVPLREDELLSSFLIRNAHAHGATPYCFLSYYWPQRQIWNRDTDRTTDHAWLDELATLTDIPTNWLEASTLLPFRRILGPTLRNGDTPLLLSVSVFHRTRRRHGLQFCPLCLSEDRPWFRRTWRLGFVLACPTHNVPLLDSCPACDSPVIPHRGLCLELSYCHQCGKSLISGRSSTRFNTDILQWQQWLLSALSETSLEVGPFKQDEIYTTVRSLLSILTARRTHTALREVLCLSDVSLPVDRLQFEHARAHERALMMETLTAWLAAWPLTFRKGANAARLTQMTFRRIKQPPALRSEVERLPLGNGKDRTYVPQVFDQELLRLARKDRKAYRALRTNRLKTLARLK